jgi:alpha-glucosidase
MNHKPTASPAMPANWADGAVVYQIYPRSLQDSNGDGIGDLKGIVQRLDYLAELGINTVWLSPFYPSPMVDFGYDIADYKNVDPIFGTLDDFKTLLAAAHERGIKVIIDLVPNHTSDEHEWFKESRRSRTNPKANWYIWRDPRIDPATEERLPPNNWRDALAGDSAWEWDEVREQYYMHSWHKRQPDLNWANHEVRQAIKDVMRFWLDMGVDGFRVDAVDWIAKDPMFRDDSLEPNYAETKDTSPYDALKHDKSRGWPTEYAYLSEMASVLYEPKYQTDHRFMVAETYQERHNPAEAYIGFYSSIDPAYAAPFNFEGLYLGWEAPKWRRFLRLFHHGLSQIGHHCVASYAFGNHDNPRLVTRLGEQAAKSAALMQLTLPGMIFVYYGEEIGMKNVELPHMLMRDVYHMSRDPERTPMQWSAVKNAGFSAGSSTWLPVGPDYKTHNVEAQQANPHSFYHFYKQLIHLRSKSEALRHGRMHVLELGHPDVLGYVRTYRDEHWVVLINFANHAVRLVPGVKLPKFILSSKLQTKLTDGIDGEIELLPHESALFLQ